MNLEIKQLRELAEAATHGPWEWDGDPSNITEEYREQEAPFLITADGTNVLFGDIKSYGLNDVHYIAAANPSVILALLDELDRLRDALTDKQDLLRHIGDYAHDRSTGPAIPDDLWEVRRMAYEGYAS